MEKTETTEAATSDTVSLSGVWKNELGSIMVLDFNKDGILTGEYHTAVGRAKIVHKLTGYHHHIPSSVGKDGEINEECCVLGFTVLWSVVKKDKSPSVTSWTGKVTSIEDRSSARISTIWTLTRSGKPLWSSTLIGKDVFSRVLE